jgi:predicted RND superfamily exporter protein
MLHRRGRAFIAAVAVVAVAAIAVLLWPGAVLPLESDLTVMHPRPNAPLAAQDRIADRFGISPDTMVVHLSAATEPDLIRLAHEVDAKLRSPATESAGIRGTFGVATLLPDPALADARCAATGPAYAERVIADFRAAVADSAFDLAAFKPYEGFLQTLLTAREPPTLATLRAYPSLASMVLPREDFETSPLTRERREAITVVFLRDPAARRESRDAAVAAVRDALKDVAGATLTGMSVLNHDVERTVRRDLPRLLAVSIAAVAVYLVVHFRSLRDALLAVLPALVGLLCLLAFMRLSGQRLNMINLIAFPLLVGIDVDYGVFVVSAARRARIDRTSMAQTLAPAVGAVLLCAATTFLGFGSLAYTSVPAARSLGVAVAVGVVACLAATIFLVTPLLLLRGGERT